MIEDEHKREMSLVATWHAQHIRALMLHNRRRLILAFAIGAVVGFALAQARQLEAARHALNSLKVEQRVIK
jgi:hypothetical protein